MKPVYYNDNDPAVAAWLRELVRAGELPDGEVDDRSIHDVQPDDLEGFDQCHFFCGIGGWPLALHRAGWGDRPVWTGSPPCQAFSVAGRRAGFDDERHLWPQLLRLIRACRPDVVIGEQVASSDVVGRVGGSVRPGDGRTWLDLVLGDLEDARYAGGALVAPVCSVGAPHVRSRLYWLAHSNDAGSQGRLGGGLGADQRAAGQDGVAGRVEDADSERREGLGLHVFTGESRQAVSEIAGRGEDGGMADAASWGRLEERQDAGGCGARDRQEGQLAGSQHGSGGERLADSAVQRRERDTRAGREAERGPELDGGGDGLADACSEDGRGHTGVVPGTAAPVDRSRREDGSVDHGSLHHGADDRGPAIAGLWGACDWVWCRDERWRPVGPGVEPLAARLPRRLVRGRDPGTPVDAASQEARVDRLSGYGNAVNVGAATAFVLTAMEVLQ